ncbi:MAG: primosomal protein N' [Nitrospirota bacterium]|nr:primosomal protein N' [Nitrospirota bacterium]
MSEAPNLSHPQLSSSVLADAPGPALVDVALPRHLYRVFTYLVPAHLQPLVRIGSRVHVPFGHTTLQGMVVELRSLSNRHLNPKGPRPAFPLIKLREINAIVDDCDDKASRELLTLSRLVSEHYLTPWGQCIRLILPAQPSVKRPDRYQLTEIGHDWLEKADSLNRLSPTCQALLARLHRRPNGLTLATLRHGASPSLAGDLSTLKRRKLILEMAQQTDPSHPSPPRPPFSSEMSYRVTDSTADLAFTDRLGTWHPESPSEATWWKNVLTAIDTSRPSRFLLHAPYKRRLSTVFQAAEAVLRQQRRVILVTPEISRAEAVASAARARWGDRVDVFHSGLPPALRYERWQRLRSGAVDVVVGTRSAIFAPVPSVGLIYIDEEENSSLKEETEPRYHARDVAWMRAQLNMAVVLLGSAHPSLEAMHLVGAGVPEQSQEVENYVGAMTVHKPIDAPEIHTVNLRETAYGTVLSDVMSTGIRAALEARVGVILFLNRKGFAPALICRDCGNAPHCPQCSVALTFYKQGGRLACRYCGTSRSLPETCPTCLAPRLQPGGIGTEAVEELTRRLFPHARVGRVDSATSPSSKHASSVRRQFIAGDLDVLIGTQMLCQGEPELSAGFVGLIQADAGLHLPDFRASEHTYHTLMETIAWARSEKTDGRVVLQTLLPTHYVIQAVANQDPALFYRQELAFRQALAYPPFTYLISLRVSGIGHDRTRQVADHWVEQLRGTGPEQLTVWGPIPSAIARLRDKFRWQIIVKSNDAEIARQCVQKTLTDLESRGGRSGIKFEVDVDPITTL